MKTKTQFLMLRRQIYGVALVCLFSFLTFTVGHCVAAEGLTGEQVQSNYEQAYQELESIRSQQQAAVSELEAARVRRLQSEQAQAEAQRQFERAQRDVEAAKAVQKQFEEGRNIDGLRQADQTLKDAEQRLAEAKKALAEKNTEFDKAKSDYIKADDELERLEKLERDQARLVDRIGGEGQANTTTDSGDSTQTLSHLSPANLTLRLAYMLHQGRLALDDIQDALRNCNRERFDAAREKLQSALESVAAVGDLGFIIPLRVSLRGLRSAAQSALNELTMRWKGLEAFWATNCGDGAVCVPPRSRIPFAGEFDKPRPQGAGNAPGLTEEEKSSALAALQRKIAAQVFQEMKNRAQSDLQGDRVSVGSDSYLLVYEEMRVALWMLRRARQVELLKSLVNLSQFKLGGEGEADGNLTQMAKEGAFSEAVDRLDLISRRLGLGELLSEERIQNLEAEREHLLSTSGVDKASYDKARVELLVHLRSKAEPIARSVWKVYVQALKEEAEFTGRLNRAQWQRYYAEPAFRESFPAYQNLQKAKADLRRFLEGNALLAMEVDLVDNLGVRRSGYLFNVLHAMGPLQHQAAQRAIDQAIAKLEDNIRNEEIRIKALRTVEEVAGEFGKQIYRPLRQHVAQQAQPLFVADPSFWMSSIEKMVRLQADDRAYSESKTDLILMGAEATFGVASIFFPPAALVEAGLIIAQVAVQGNRLVLSYRELATQETAVDAGGRTSRVALSSADKAIEARWGTFVDTVAITPLALAGSAASFFAPYAKAADSIDAVTDINRTGGKAGDVADGAVSAGRSGLRDGPVPLTAEDAIRDWEILTGKPPDDLVRSLKETGLAVVNHEIKDMRLIGEITFDPATRTLRAEFDLTSRSSDASALIKGRVSEARELVVEEIARAVGAEEVTIVSKNFQNKAWFDQVRALGYEPVAGRAQVPGTVGPDLAKTFKVNPDQSLDAISDLTAPSGSISDRANSALANGGDVPSASGAVKPPGQSFQEVRTQPVTGGGCAALPTERPGDVSGVLRGAAASGSPPAEISIRGGPVIELTDPLGKPGGSGGCYRGIVVGEPPPGWPKEVAVKQFHEEAPYWVVPDEQRGHQLATQARPHAPPPRILGIVEGSDGRIYLVSELVGGDPIAAAYSTNRLLDGSPLPGEFRPPRDVTYVPQGRGLIRAEQAADIEALEEFVKKGIIAWDWKNGNIGFKVEANTGKRTAFPIDRGLFERAPPTPLLADVIPEDSTQTLLQMWSVSMGGLTPWRNPLNSLAGLPEEVLLGLTTDAGVQTIIAQEGLGRIKFNTTTRRFESASHNIDLYREKDNLGKALARIEGLQDQYATKEIALPSRAPAGNPSSAGASAEIGPNDVSGGGAARGGASSGVVAADEGSGSSRSVIGGRSAGETGDAQSTVGGRAQVSNLRTVRYVLELTAPKTDQMGGAEMAGGTTQTGTGPFATVVERHLMCWTRLYDPILLPWGGFWIPIDTKYPEFFERARKQDKKISSFEKDKGLGGDFAAESSVKLWSEIHNVSNLVQ